jgi:hypothetical protein
MNIHTVHMLQFESASSKFECQRRKWTFRAGQLLTDFPGIPLIGVPVTCRNWRMFRNSLGCSDNQAKVSSIGILVDATTVQCIRTNAILRRRSVRVSLCFETLKCPHWKSGRFLTCGDSCCSDCGHGSRQFWHVKWMCEQGVPTITHWWSSRIRKISRVNIERINHVIHRNVARLAVRYIMTKLGNSILRRMNGNCLKVDALFTI